MRSDEEAKAPLEAYYAAPKHKFEKLLGTSDWSLFDSVFLGSWCLLIFVQIVFEIIGRLWIEYNRIGDGILVITSWLILVMFFWLHHRKKVWKDSKFGHLVFLIVVSLASIIRTANWISEYVF